MKYKFELTYDEYCTLMVTLGIATAHAVLRKETEPFAQAVLKSVLDLTNSITRQASPEPSTCGPCTL